MNVESYLNRVASRLEDQMSDFRIDSERSAFLPHKTEITATKIHVYFPKRNRYKAKIEIDANGFAMLKIKDGKIEHFGDARYCLPIIYDITNNFYDTEEI